MPPMPSILAGMPTGGQGHSDRSPPPTGHPSSDCPDVAGDSYASDSRTWVAATVLGYLEAWMRGDLTV